MVHHIIHPSDKFDVEINLTVIKENDNKHSFVYFVLLLKHIFVCSTSRDDVMSFIKIMIKQIECSS